MESAYAPLSESCAKALSDKVYDKRKVAVQEIEKCVFKLNIYLFVFHCLTFFRMVIEFNLKKNSAQIRKLIEVLSNDFAASRDANKRKGGLIGLAATSLGLGKVSANTLSPLLTLL